MKGRMRRREFVALLGGAAAAWPVAARAQQPVIPVIGFLHPISAEANAYGLAACRQGLKQAGFVEGENVVFEHRSAANQMDRLPALAADLVRRRVAVIVTATEPAIVAAKAAATSTPIVFITGQDPVRRGLVASLARPGGNLTGVNFLLLEVGAKRLELLRRLVPGAARVAVLVSPANAAITETTLQEVEPAARALGLQIQVFKADTKSEIDVVFAELSRNRPDALFVSTGPFFDDRRVQLAHWATRTAIPAAFGIRQYADVGGLMSYGTSLAEAFHQVGLYIGRILKGTKPADLPVVQSTKLELVINHQTARIIGLTVPPTLLAIADEVIE
jgi:putative ABC transport system substrate-binding protein